MQVAQIKSNAFASICDEDCQQRIIAAKNKLGKNLVILAHH